MVALIPLDDDADDLGFKSTAESWPDPARTPNLRLPMALLGE